MTAFRYWRAVSLQANGSGDLELSTFHLLADGARVDGAAVLSTNSAPDAPGVLANLQNETPNDSVKWSSAAVPALVLSWDFGAAPAAVDDIRLAGDSASRFPQRLFLQGSSDGVTWTALPEFHNIEWPGFRQNTTSLSCLPIQLREVSPLVILNAVTSLNLSVPAGARVGDILVACIMRRSALSVPAGWTSAGSAGPTTDGINQFTDVLYKFAAPADLNSSFTFTQASAGRFLGQLVVLRGVDATQLSTASYPLVLEVSAATIAMSVPLQVGQLLLVAASVIQYPTDGSLPLWIGSRGLIGINSVEVPDNRLGVLFQQTTPIEPRSTPNITPPLLVGQMTRCTVVFSGKSRITQNRRRAGRIGIETLTTGPALAYGTPEVLSDRHQRVTEGARDRITGVLGQGVGRVHGTVKNTGVPNMPVARRVRLLRESDLLVVREQWSDPITGAYDFRFVDELQRYTVIAFDHTQLYSAVVADNLTPEPMP